MRYRRQEEQLKSQLSTHLPEVISSDLCNDAIKGVMTNTDETNTEQLFHKYIEQFSELIFCSDVKQFLLAYYNEEFECRWPIFNIIDDTAMKTYYSTTWHRDGGMPGMLKLFLYLNPVSEHGCNTLMFDVHRSQKLFSAGALPMETNKRLHNVSGFLEEMNLSTKAIAYDLQAGDLLIFDPTRLAHRCHPPTAGKKRYSICFSVFPNSAFQ